MELSVRTVEKNLDLILNYFVKKGIKLSKYICGKEFGTKNAGEHYHYHLVITKYKGKIESLMTSIRRKLYKFYNNKNFYVKQVKDTTKHELYVTKDGDYESEGYSDEELESLDKQNGAIDYDKQLPVYQKLYNRLNSSIYDEPLAVRALDKRLLIEEILTIYKEWNVCPPTKSDMFRYINYILIQQDLISVSVENYI